MLINYFKVTLKRILEDEMHMKSVTILARAVVGKVAREELPLFPAMSRAYVDDPGRARVRRGQDEAMGFGWTDIPTLLTPVALAAADQIARYLADDFANSLMHMAGDAIAERIAKLFRREAGAPVLTSAQLVRIRNIAMEVARAENMTEPRATLLADALVGHLTGAVSTAP